MADELYDHLDLDFSSFGIPFMELKAVVKALKIASNKLEQNFCCLDCSRCRGEYKYKDNSLLEDLFNKHDVSIKFIETDGKLNPENEIEYDTFLCPQCKLDKIEYLINILKLKKEFQAPEKSQPINEIKRKFRI